MSLFEFGTKSAHIESASGSADIERITSTRSGEISKLPIALLQFSESPRLAGQNRKYAEQLAESDTLFPPILVNRRNIQVIDGVHRVLATLLRGQKTIEARIVDLSRNDAFLLAIESNSRHGLPLSLADRRAATARLIASHPHLSDRAIAQASGLGAKSVAAIRRSTASRTELNTRTGQDGRVRPLDRAAGRHRAAEVIAQNRQASVREVARIAGISPATASDVRKRILAGESVVGESTRQAATAPEPSAEPPSEPPSEPRQIQTPEKQEPQEKPTSLLEPLLHDPLILDTELGRRLVGSLRNNLVGVYQWLELADAVPPHCGDLVIALAQQNADTWREFAQALDERALPSPQLAAGSPQLAAGQEDQTAPAN
ncbi:ParB/RepB/Spo0J family partition protein [Streptomyces sp. NPDC054855]